MRNCIDDAISPIEVLFMDAVNRRGFLMAGAGLTVQNVAFVHGEDRQAFGVPISAQPQARAKYAHVPQDAILYADFQNDVYYVGGAVFNDRTKLPGWTTVGIPNGAIGKMTGYTFPARGTVYVEWRSADTAANDEIALSSYDDLRAILWSSTLGRSGKVGLRTIIGGKSTQHPSGGQVHADEIVRHVIAYDARSQRQSINGAPLVTTAAGTASSTSELRFGYFGGDVASGGSLSKVIIWNKQLRRALLRNGAATGHFPHGLALGPLVRPEDFDPNAGTGFDDRLAIQAAMDFVGARGFGKLQLSAPKIYHIRSRSSFVTNGGSNKAALIVRFDNILIDIQPGAKLYLDDTTPTQLFYRSGTAKGRGSSVLPTPRDSRNYAGTFNSANSTWELVKINPAEIGERSVWLQVPSDASKFRIGDWVLLRAGNTLAAGEPSSYDTPFGQYSRVAAVDAQAGMVSLDRQMVWPINSQRYPPRHHSAGLEIPWGMINLSYPIDAFINGFCLSGAIEMRGSPNHTVIVGNFTAYNVLGTAAKPLVISTDGNCFSMGQSRSSAFVSIRECGMLMISGQTCWVACNDACNHEMTWNVTATGTSMYIHTHEGTTGFDITANLTAKAQWHEEAGFRAYAKNGRFNLSLHGISAGWPGVYLDGSTTGIAGSVFGRGPSVRSASDVCGNDGTSNKVSVSS